MRSDPTAMTAEVGTCVIGAGPAGLLFCIATRILQAREGPSSELAPLWLFDRRSAYERTHRMRLAEEPYRRLAADLGDPRFDALISFLAERRFRVEVNVLEGRLLALATELGIRKETLAIGDEPGELDLAGLRAWLDENGRLPRGAPLCVVGADSVRSSVLALAPTRTTVVDQTHQHLTRLRVVGPQLPASLGLVNQFKLSKILASLLDYRLSSSGHAEVDLFLAAHEHKRLTGLGATPRSPVLLDGATLRSLRAPLFAAIVERLSRGFGGGPCEVWLQSTFTLQHRYVERPTFTVAEHDITVFLVGDAAVSLPFQRGMACLARCVESLAHVHRDWVALHARTEDEHRQAAVETESAFLRPGRPVVYGTQVLPGRIVRVAPTVYRGHSAHVVVNGRGLHSVHVLARTGNGGWRSLHHRQAATKRAALTDFRMRTDPRKRYVQEVRHARDAELRVVKARSRLVRVLREFVRVSAALPFPLQTWLLSEPEVAPPTWRLTRAFWLNLALAVAALAVVTSALAFGALVEPRWCWTWLAAVPFQLAGGAAYAATLAFGSRAAPVVKATWRVQIAVLFVVGLGLAAVAETRAVSLLAVMSWFLLAGPFVAGMYLFEALERRWWHEAAL